MHSGHGAARRRKARDCAGHLGHASRVTQNVYGKNCWEEREDAVTQAVEAMTNAAQNAEKEENPPELAPADGARITS